MQIFHLKDANYGEIVADFIVMAEDLGEANDLARASGINGCEEVKGPITSPLALPSGVYKDVTEVDVPPDGP